MPIRAICSWIFTLRPLGWDKFGYELNSSLGVAQENEMPCLSPCFAKELDRVPQRGPSTALLRGVCGQWVLRTVPQLRVPEHADICSIVWAPRGLRGLEEAGKWTVW